MLATLFQDVTGDEMINLLADCQDCAITMGNKIETVYGSDIDSVDSLEKYCESLFQISQNLDNLSACLEIYEQSKELLLRVHSTIENIPDKKEIVFMPYKASMWDSLESVFLAARDDDDCEAYVVPIPYFDRKSDKSLGEMHYEGNEYPPNIPITNWEEYSFEERQPDVIYIHNAYDDSNLVTCVHPRFFSSNLKKYTEKLVYIPYFVLEEIDPKDQKKIDGIKHFCFMPGIVNADKVILQSENMRRIYINEYAKVIESAGGSIDRKKLEEKFLGIGSPKFDKVLNTRKEDLDIPEEWLKIIQKPDGSRKKINFYNTSVTALLQHNEKMLEKMQYVFSVFKEHKDEVALLWRPHPLIKTTIESMRPQLWEEYYKIVEQYKEEGWGIYDDTTDMDRAVVLSEAYYGDSSSVSFLFEIQNKIAVIQNIGLLSTNQNGLISIYDYTKAYDKIFFCGKRINAIFIMDYKCRKIEAINLLGDNQFDFFMYSSVVLYKNSLFLIPYMADRCIVVDLCLQVKKTIDGYPISGIKKTVKYGRFLYMINGQSLFDSWILDMENYEMIPFTKFIEVCVEESEKMSVNYHGEICIVDDSFYVSSKMKGIILEVNMRTRRLCEHLISQCNLSFSTINFDGKNFWLTGDSLSIVKWNKRDGFWSDIRITLNDFDIDTSCPWKDYFSCCVIMGSFLYLFPLAANMIVKVDMQNNEMEKVMCIEK